MNRREFAQTILGAVLAQGLLAQDVHSDSSPQMFQFSVMLWTLEKQRSIDQCIEIVAEAGYRGVELVGEFEKWSAQDTRRILAKMDSLRLIFDAMVGGSFTLADPAATSLVQKEFPKRIALAKDLGCNQLIFTSGKKVAGLSPETQQSAMMDTLSHIADLAAKSNMQVVIEPIDPIERPDAYLTSVTQGFEIVRTLNRDNVKVLYDFYHEQRASGNLIEKLEQNIQWVGLVHVADVPGRHKPGTGEIDYENIYRKLGELKYNKFIAMEFYPTGDPVQELKTARLDAIKAARSSSVV